MKDILRTGQRARPIGYFVHHQGRGHAERCRAVVNALPLTQPVTIFCARKDIFPRFDRPVEIITIPSLFEASGDDDINDTSETPRTVHCAPLGWPGIRTAMATLANWFAVENPILMISDVSAEIAQLARICSVPHVMVLQHGDRSDQGHQAAYDGAVGLLCPSDQALAQPDWSDAMRAKTFFAGGLGVAHKKATANKAALSLDPGKKLILVMSGGGGEGWPSAPLAVGARALPQTEWVTIGKVACDWHATEPHNMHHRGWVDNPYDYLSAADLVISSTGNTSCHQILAAGKPWLAIPEWRYFDEQRCKADALRIAGAATTLAHLPSSVDAWRVALARTVQAHQPDRQKALITPRAAETAADWLMELIGRLSPMPMQDKGRDHAISAQ